ncbi:hypothetical protein [Streptomyces eurythermus]|uniref:hypothetical protein n=1 Tax=Streptomyces eurythermus TaxID=42237 RepID=UPI0033F60DFE
MGAQHAYPLPRADRHPGHRPGRGGGRRRPAHASCFDRATRPYTSVVDSHLHYSPFGGKAIPFEELNTYLRTAYRIRAQK